MTRSANDAAAPSADGCKCCASAVRHKIYQYLARSAGTGNHPTDHTLQCFVGMVQTGEATVEDMHAVGGDFLMRELHRVCEDNGWSLCCE